MIDACAFHEWPSVSALYPYLPDGYREILAPSTVIASPRRLADPRGAKKAADALPENGVAGSDFDLFRQQLLDDGRRERVVLELRRRLAERDALRALLRPRSGACSE